MGVALPNILKFARKLVKCQPYCKRVGYHISTTFCSSNYICEDNSYSIYRAIVRPKKLSSIPESSYSIFEF